MTNGSDLSAYFARIGHDGSVAPTFDTLNALVGAHVKTLAFENLNPLMGFPIYDLSPAVLFDKMVHQARGGYCYELNGLLHHVLTEVGFEVGALGARVVWGNPDWMHSPASAQTHQLLLVRIPGDEQPYLADVGFGGQTLTSPVRLSVGEEQKTRHEPYRVSRVAGSYVLETQISGVWRALYLFTDEIRPPIDLQVSSWYVSTHPGLRWVNSLVVSTVTDDARLNLTGRILTVRSLDGHAERTRFDNATQVLDVLMNQFGIDVGGLGDVHERITQVLDA